MPRNTPPPARTLPGEEIYSLSNRISTIYVSALQSSRENAGIKSDSSIDREEQVVESDSFIGREDQTVEPDNSIDSEEQSLVQAPDSHGNVALTVILVFGTASCITTMFAEGDMLSYLWSLAFQGGSVAANVVTSYVVPCGTTVPINGVLRAVNFARAIDAIMPFYEGKKSRREFLAAVKSALPYVIPTILTAGVDVYIGVYTSSSARDLFPPIVLNIETVLSFFYMLPIDFLGLYDLHGRMQRFSEKLRGIDDRQQVYERGMAAYAFLKNLSREEQERELREILIRQDESNLQAELINVPSPEEIKSMPRERYDPLVEKICKDKNLNDGSSMLSQVAIPVSLALSLGTGIATSYSPVENVYLKHDVPPGVAWPLGGVSGTTKGSFYAVSYDTLFRFVRLGPNLFPSLLLRINVAWVASFAGIGFWEVVSHAVKGFTGMGMGPHQDVESAGMMPWYDGEDPDSRGTEAPPAWFYEVCTLLLLAGLVANTAACFGLLLRVMEKRRKGENGLDHAAAILERASDILVTSKAMEAARNAEVFVRDDEEQQLMPPSEERSRMSPRTYGTSAEVASLNSEQQRMLTLVSSDEDRSTTPPRADGSGSSVELASYLSGGSNCFFHDTQPRRTFGVTGCLERTFGRLLGFNF